MTYNHYRLISLEEIAFEQEVLLDLTAHFCDEPGVCLLFSGSDYDSSCTSFLCMHPLEVIQIDDDKANPWDVLKSRLPKLNGSESFPEWVGFITYEMGAYSDLEVTLSHHKGDLPYCYFQRSGFILKVDNHSKKGELYLHDDLENVDLSFLKKKIISDKTKSRILKPLDTLQEYIHKIKDAIEWIYSGEIYQVNLSQQLLLDSSKHPFTVFSELVNNNPAPFSAYFRLGHYTLISSSPERLLQKTGNSLETRPIKGTAPRGLTHEDDERSKENLLRSEKDRAELLMITDLMRNDLGKVSEIGSVKVEKIYHCEAYTNVFHLLSVIKSFSLPEMHPVDILRSSFPGGSITGCPKLRAMEAIDHLEKRSRGIYTGSIGYFSSNGDFDFNIAIRTMYYHEGIYDIQIGGAIVTDSDPEKEYRETLYKGSSMFQAFNLTL